MTDPRFDAMIPEPSEAMQYTLLRAIMQHVQPVHPDSVQGVLEIIKSYDAARTQAINSLSNRLYNALMVAPAPVYIMPKPQEPK